MKRSWSAVVQKVIRVKNAMGSVIDIYKKFLEIYPIPEGFIDHYSRIDPCRIKIRLKNRKELIFTYVSSNKWRVESIDLYRKEKKKNEK